MKTKKSLRTMLVLALAAAVVPVSAYAVDDVSDTAYINVSNNVESGNGIVTSEGNRVKFETGNISVDGNNPSSVPEVYQKNGLYVTGKNVESKTTLDVIAGNIAVANNPDDAGLKINSFQDVQSNVTTGNITSEGIGVDIYKSGDDDLTVKTGNIISVKQGINVSSYSGKNTIAVGDVLSYGVGEDNATAVFAKFEKTDNSLSVGKIQSEGAGVGIHACETANANFESKGITAKSGGFIAYVGSDIDRATSGSVTATINGDVVTDNGPAVGALASTPGSHSDVTVKGNVKSGSNVFMPVVALYSPGGIDDDIGGHGFASNTMTINGSVTALSDGKIPTAISISSGYMSGNNLNVNGDVNANGDDSLGLGLNGSGKDVVKIDGDINAGEVGIYADVYENEENKPGILVTGTVSSGKVGIVLDGSTTKNNLDLTVWKVVPNEEGNVSEEGRIAYGNSGDGNDVTQITDAFFEYAGATETTKDFEKSIKYIIKVEQPNNGAKLIALKADGTALDLSYNYEIAYEGDKVILKALPEKGYRITAAYNGLSGEKVALEKDGNGNYYINVPKGGGVYLSALFEKIKYNISYDLAGGSWNGNGGIITFQSAYGDKITLISAPTRPGYRFVCWKGSAYKPGDIYEVIGDHTFTAVWEKIEDQKQAEKNAKYDGKKVKTGDENNMVAWIYSAFASMFGFMLSLVAKKPKKNRG